MKIKIESDVFDINSRIKDIDDGYFILFDLIKNKVEVHNAKQSNSYCFTSKYSNVDSRIIDEIESSLVSNIDKIIRDIDTSNDKIEQNSIKSIKDNSDYMLREIYKYSANSTKEYTANNAFSTIWS